MKESLEKIIKRIILPKYPFIVDYEVTKTGDDMYKRYGRYFYRVNLFLDVDITPEDFPSNKISGDMENLFSVLGPNDDEVLEGTEFYRSNRPNLISIE